MKKLASVFFCISLCLSIAVLFPGYAACEEPLQICNCDTGVMDIIIPSASAEMTTTLLMSDLIDECAASAQNPGNFKSCVSKLTNAWRKDDLINGREKGAIQSCAAGFKPVETADYVDVESFLGVWYQIARYFNPAEGNLSDVTAEYTLNGDGTVGVLNSGRVENGSLITIEGFARVVDEKTNSKLTVAFTNPAVDGEFEYWILEVAEDYSHAVVSNSIRSTLYILSRTPAMETSVYEGIINRLDTCFDPGKIIRTPQND